MTTTSSSQSDNVAVQVQVQVPATTASCPCCTFFLQSNDLFLPVQLSETKEVLSSDTNVCRNNNNNNNNIENATNNNTNNDSILSPLDALDLISSYNKINCTSKNNIQEVEVEAEQQQQQQQQRVLRIVDTHGHAHLNGDSTTCYYHELTNFDNDIDDDNDTNNDNFLPKVFSLTCAVQESDWDDCIEYVSKSKYRIGAIGIHPWYASNLNDNDHYDDDWIQKLESLLQQHPNCMIGEIGLCKVAKFIRTYKYGKAAAIQLQYTIFYKQMILAWKYHRPVTIHCVNQHGTLLTLLKQLASQHQVPHCIALHSYNGTVHHVKQLLQWENDYLTSTTKSNKQQQRRRRHKKDNNQQNGDINDTNRIPEQEQEDDQIIIQSSQSSSSRPLLYFGFSHCINYVMCTSDKSQRQQHDTIRSIPKHRLLVESDVQNQYNVAAATAGSIAYLAFVLNEPIPTITELTYNNGIQFLQSIYYTSLQNIKT